MFTPRLRAVKLKGMTPRDGQLSTHTLAPLMLLAAVGMVILAQLWTVMPIAAAIALAHAWLATTQLYLTANDRKVQADFYAAAQQLDSWQTEPMAEVVSWAS
jgi:hypothetical protein